MVETGQLSACPGATHKLQDRGNRIISRIIPVDVIKTLMKGTIARDEKSEKEPGDCMTCEETDQDLCQRICPGIRVPRKCKFQGCPPPEIPESSEVFGERANYSKKANLLLKEMFLIKGNADEETLVSMHPAILKHTPAFSLGIISMMASANTMRHLYESCQTVRP